MRAPMESSSFSDEDDELPLPLRARLAAAEEKARKRARSSVAKPERILSTSSGPSAPPPPAAVGAHPASAAAAGVVVAVEDTDALDCGICCLPLKAPIFQCDVGHVVCSVCRDKLKDNRKCHVCRGATGGFRRCHAMERLVESARVACPNAAYGCMDRPAYHDQQGHLQLCLHTPCRCPGESCSFVGMTEALLHHFTSVHGWPCSTKVRTDEMFYISLKDGSNFLRLEDYHGASTARANRQCLFLLDVKRQELSRAISVLLIHPHTTVEDQHPCLKKMICELTYLRRFVYNGRPCSDQVHDQKSKFLVNCTDLSNGLPKPEERFQFIVPNFVLTHNEKKDGIEVGFRIQPFPQLGTS